MVNSSRHDEANPLGPFGSTVGFLVSQVGAATARLFAESLEELQLEPRHFAVLRAIEGAGRCPQQLLSELLRIPASSLVAILDQLEERGIVQRVSSPKDRRVRFVELTAAGAATLLKAAKVAMATERHIGAGFTAAEREQLISMLRRVADNLGLIHGVHPGSPEDHKRSPTR